ncbi:Blp family class II bacteriocin [Dysgonomonas gadei]|uniref:Bacteriocin-type signal sequence n=1 Tax=Dysgonomonas gadei ATCC BAA-286 TaxID=742766 RepID=F5IUS8_9BACT|nr:Blp family class II bacteriocin [Dysgonomonas gadei]EGK02978.1 hypothetical protein HMPREF9455_01228 [Dysgonomonas gadei ATCC BAA-286]
MEKELTTLNETSEFKELTKEEMAAINGGYAIGDYLKDLYESAGAAVAAGAAAGAAAIR